MRLSRRLVDFLREFHLVFVFVGHRRASIIQRIQIPDILSAFYRIQQYNPKDLLSYWFDKTPLIETLL